MGYTSKEITPDGRAGGALRALHLLGVDLGDLQDQTLLVHEKPRNHRDPHNYRKKANTIASLEVDPDYYDPETGRLYPQPKVAAAVTGRVLYSDPNAQGVDKKRTDEFRGS